MLFGFMQPVSLMGMATAFILSSRELIDEEYQKVPKANSSTGKRKLNNHDKGAREG